MRCRTEVGPDGQQQSVMALVWVNARFRLHLRSPGAACRRPSGVIRPSAPLPSVAARVSCNCGIADLVSVRLIIITGHVAC